MAAVPRIFPFYPDAELPTDRGDSGECGTGAASAAGDLTDLSSGQLETMRATLALAFSSFKEKLVSSTTFRSPDPSDAFYAGDAPSLQRTFRARYFMVKPKVDKLNLKSRTCPVSDLFWKFCLGDGCLASYVSIMNELTGVKLHFTSLHH